MKSDIVEAKPLNMQYEHVPQLLADNPRMLVAIYVTDVFDKPFAIVTEQYACPFYKGSMMFHKFRGCPSLAAPVRKETAYTTIDLRWNPDFQSKPSTNVPTRQLIFGKAAIKKSTFNNIHRHRRDGSSSRIVHVKFAAIPLRHT